MSMCRKCKKEVDKYTTFFGYCTECQKTVKIKDNKIKIKYEPIPSYGALMTIKDWLSCVKCGTFIDYDGHGQYAFEDKMSNITVYPSDVKKRKIYKTFTHIMWFNR